jgi:hypothetical protein
MEMEEMSGLYDKEKNRNFKLQSEIQSLKEHEEHCHSQGEQ